MHPRDGDPSVEARDQSRRGRRRGRRRLIRRHSRRPELPPRKPRIGRRGEERRRRREAAMATIVHREEIRVGIEERIRAPEKGVDSARDLPQGGIGIGAERLRFGEP